jgi:hypothetical protein
MEKGKQIIQGDVKDRLIIQNDVIMKGLRRRKLRG